MSTTQTHIVMVGVQLDFNKYGKLEISNKFDCVIDGMNGNYIVVGRTINEGNYYEGLDFDSINLLT